MAFFMSVFARSPQATKQSQGITTLTMGLLRFARNDRGKKGGRCGVDNHV
jgi:hypothetical protein